MSEIPSPTTESFPNKRLASYELRDMVMSRMDDILLRCEEVDSHLTGELLTQSSEYVSTTEIPLADMVDLSYVDLDDSQDPEERPLGQEHTWSTLQIKRLRTNVVLPEELHGIRYVALYREYTHNPDGSGISLGDVKLTLKDPADPIRKRGMINGKLERGPVTREEELKLSFDLHRALQAIEAVGQEPEVLERAPLAEVIALESLAQLAEARRAA